ncbi:MAG: hypothetical protein LBR84_06360 [Tannerella sp.]|jgi:hypothetical protein|nr:hypothetical protein [Tannerella sp.]
MKKEDFLRKVAITVAVLAAVATMTACNSGGNKQQKAETPETTKQAAPAKQGKLFDITDGQITAYKIQGARQVALSGDERTKMLAAIPAATKKGVGELKQGFNTVQENLATGVGYIISFQFKVSG